MAEEHKKPTINADATVVNKFEQEMLQLIKQSKPLSSELIQTYFKYGVPKEEAKSLFLFLLENAEESKRKVKITASEEDTLTPDFAAPPRMTAVTTPGLEIAPPRMTAQITGEMTQSGSRRRNSDSSDGHEEFFSHDGVEKKLVDSFKNDMRFEKSGDS